MQHPLFMFTWNKLVTALAWFPSSQPPHSLNTFSEATLSPLLSSMRMRPITAWPACVPASLLHSTSLLRQPTAESKSLVLTYSRAALPMYSAATFGLSSVLTVSAVQ